MPDDNKITNYSAADIEKYWKGQLSTSEMHALEKAAMEDPFLADALEGYKNISSATDDIKLLNQKLSDRIGEAVEVIPMAGRKFPWLRVAAAVIILGGAGIFASQFIFNKDKNSEIATVEQNKVPAEIKSVEQPVSADSLTTIVPSTTTAQPDAKKQVENKVATNSFSGKASIKTDSIKINYTESKAPPVVSSIDKPSTNPSAVSSVPQKRDIAVTEKNKDAAAGAIDDKSRGYDQKYVTKESKTPDSRNSESIQALSKSNNNNALNNLYLGRITDQQNSPVPFANVMNTHDRVGTYTDVNGNFNLVSADSLLEIQVRSLGYETKNFRLTPQQKSAELVIREDLKARQDIIASNRKVVNSRAREENRVFEEPEPEVGWNNYDTYVLNNLNIPDDTRRAITGREVELSFQVDKSGNPTNIKITKSLCKECDEEVIRLIKEGPKWKRAGKTSKTTITIAMEK